MRSITTARRAVWVVPVVLASIAACADIDEPIRGLGAIEIVGANNQDIIIGQTNPLTLTVRVLDQSALAATGVTVNWTVVSGGGTLSSPTSVTNATGMASVTYTPPTTPATVFVRALAEDLSVTFAFNVINPPVDGGG